MVIMERPKFQLSVASMLGLVACAALNIWLFRIGPLVGLVGLNISKHVVIACLCRNVGVDCDKGHAQSRAGNRPPLQDRRHDPCSSRAQGRSEASVEVIPV